MTDSVPDKRRPRTRIEEDLASMAPQTRKGEIRNGYMGLFYGAFIGLFWLLALFFSPPTRGQNAAVDAVWFWAPIVASASVTYGLLYLLYFMFIAKTASFSCLFCGYTAAFLRRAWLRCPVCGCVQVLAHKPSSGDKPEIEACGYCGRKMAMDHSLKEFVCQDCNVHNQRNPVGVFEAKATNTRTCECGEGCPAQSLFCARCGRENDAAFLTGALNLDWPCSPIEHLRINFYRSPTGCLHFARGLNSALARLAQPENRRQWTMEKCGMAVNRLGRWAVPALEEYMVFTSDHEGASELMRLVGQTYADLLDRMADTILQGPRELRLNARAFQKLEIWLSIEKEEARLRTWLKRDGLRPTWPQFHKLQLDADRNVLGVRVDPSILRNEAAYIRGNPEANR